MIVLTGIKPTGRPHLGNYVGAIAPALELQKPTDHRCTYFIADYHALVNQPSPEMMARHSMDVAACWLACGLDPNQSVLYRQSDIPEIFELQWILTCFAPKGMMNRSHAYKAQKAQSQIGSNPSADNNADDNITMGLFNYPILMAADILIAHANLVPVGSDQQQHVEITRDLALKFHHHYQHNIFTIPEIKLAKDSRPLVGLDGRKMSKSYQNHIPLFLSEAELKKLIAKIPTDSSSPTDPKPTSGTLYELYTAFATPEQINELNEQYQQGIGWGAIKQQLTAHLSHYFAAATARYHQINSKPDDIADILAHGAAQMRPSAQELLEQVKSIIGLKL